jgi:hypothetical protein
MSSSDSDNEYAEIDDSILGAAAADEVARICVTERTV